MNERDTCDPAFFQLWMYRLLSFVDVRYADSYGSRVPHTRVIHTHTHLVGMFKGRHDPHMEDHEQMLPAFNPFCMSYDSFRAVGVLSVREKVGGEKVGFIVGEGGFY